MYYEVTERKENFIEFEIAKIADAIRKAFEATEIDNDFEEGYDDEFCCAEAVPAVQNEEVCVADNFYAENRLSLNSKRNTFSRRAAKPRGRFKGGHLIFPYFLYGRKAIIL